MPSIPVTHTERTAIMQQTAIGWMQFFNGCISKMWSDIQDQYLRDIELYTQCSNGSPWAKQVIKLIWQHFFILWTQYNEIRHGKNNQGIRVYQREILLANCEALYMLKDRLLARGKNLIFLLPL
eukprot:13475708-Ditylum_brightwellii.AAC.1